MFLAKKLFPVLYGIALFGLLVGSAMAQYNVHLHATPPREVKIREILEKPVNGDFVIIEGFIHERQGSKYYRFWDGDDFIKIESYDRRLKDKKIKSTSKVEVAGIVEIGEDNKPVIRTRQIIILSQ